jgi:hypothetical protein
MDRHGRGIHDFDSVVDFRHSISHTTIRHGSKAYVEYTAEAWFCENGGIESTEGYRLTLLSMGLLESPHSNRDFDSARKKRRYECVLIYISDRINNTCKPAILSIKKILINTPVL